MSASKVIRWAGLAAVIAGALTIVTQILHPANDPSEVGTGSWAIAHYLFLGYFVFALLGLTGIYAKQVEQAGVLGLVGFLALFVALPLSTPLVFLEAAILPVLAGEAPQFVEGFFEVFAGPGSQTNLGALGGAFVVVLLLSIIGGLLFGIATIRAGVFPRWAAILYLVGVVSIILAFLVGDLGARISGVVTGLAIAWLGYALWSERGEEASQPSPAMQT